MGGELGKVGGFETPMYDLLDTVLDYYHGARQGKLDEVLSSFHREHPDSDLLFVLDAMRKVAEGRTSNLLANGDFQADAGENLPLHRTPTGWGFWRTASCPSRVALKRGPQRSIIAEIAAAKSAVLMQDIDVSPGQVYYASARVRHLPANAAGTVLLVGGLQDSNGAWMDGQSTHFQTTLNDDDGRWHAIRIVMHVPERAGRLRFMCSAKGMDEHESAQFDDVVLVRVDR